MADGVCGFTIAILTTHFIPYAIDPGIAPSTAATALGVMNGLNVVGVIVMSALADRCGRKNLLALVYAARGCAYALLTGVEEEARMDIMIGLVFFGVGLGLILYGGFVVGRWLM
ncbi:MAG TPA: hypothetical protein VGC99_26960 [Candidatus Tectomicrobia bacterium]